MAQHATCPAWALPHPHRLQNSTAGLHSAGLLGHLNQYLQGDVDYRATEVQTLTSPFYAPAPASAYAPTPAAWLPLPAQPQVQVQIQLQGSGLVPLTPQLAQGVSSGLSTLFRAFNINFRVTGMVPSDVGRDVWPAMQLQLAAAAPAGLLPEPGTGMAAANAPSPEPEPPAGLPRPHARLLPEVATSLAAAGARDSTAKPPEELPGHTAGLLPEAGMAVVAPGPDLEPPEGLLGPVSTLSWPPPPRVPLSPCNMGLPAIPQASGAHMAVPPGPTGTRPHLQVLQSAAEPAPQPCQPANALRLGRALQAAAGPQTGCPAPATTQPPAAGATPEPAVPLPASEAQQPQKSPPNTAPTGFAVQAPHDAQYAALPDISSTPAHPKTGEVPRQQQRARLSTPLAADDPTAHREQGVAPAQPNDSAREQEGCTPTLFGPDAAPAASWTAAKTLFPLSLPEHQPTGEAAGVPGLSALLQPGSVRRRLQAAQQAEQAGHGQAGRAGLNTGSSTQEQEVPGGEAALEQAVHGTAGRATSGSGVHLCTQAGQQPCLAGRHLHFKHVQADRQADTVSKSMYRSHVNGHRDPTRHQTHQQAHPKSDHIGTSGGSPHKLMHHKHWPQLRSPSPDGPSQSPTPEAVSSHLNFTQLLSRLGLLMPSVPFIPPRSAQAWTLPPDFRYLTLPKPPSTSLSSTLGLNHHSPPQPSQIDASPPLLEQAHTARAELAFRLQQASPQPSLLRSSRALRILLQQAGPSLTPYINVTATLSPSGLLLNNEQPAPVFASMAVDSTRLNMAFVASLLHADGLPVENAVFLGSNLPGDSSGEGFMPCGLCCHAAA